MSKLICRIFKTANSQKENRQVSARGKKWRVGKMDKGVQKLETSRYKINKLCEYIQ